MSMTVDATQRDAGGGPERKSIDDVDRCNDAGGVEETAGRGMKASVSAEIADRERFRVSCVLDSSTC